MKAAWVVVAALAFASNGALAVDLPDFTELVEAHPASVVNTSTVRRVEQPSQRQDVSKSKVVGCGINVVRNLRIPL